MLPEEITLVAHLADILPAITSVEPQVMAIGMKIANVLSHLSSFTFFLVQTELAPVDKQSSSIGSDVSRIPPRVAALAPLTRAPA